MMLKRRFFGFLVPLALAVFFLATWAQADPGNRSDVAGAVYTMSNATAGNSILVFDRRADGHTLLPAVRYPTGGLGTGSGLGNQSGLVLSPDQRWLFAVNAGSNEVSAFAVKPGGLELVDRINTGGNLPVSLALDRKLLYVRSCRRPQ